MRQPLAPDRVARFLSNLDKFLQQWHLEIEDIAGKDGIPSAKTIYGWMLEGKRPSECSVRNIGYRFGITWHAEQLLDKDFTYGEIERTRQGVMNAKLARAEDEAEKQAKASLSGDKNADANYLSLMNDPGYRPYLAMSLGLMVMKQRERRSKEG